MKIPKFKPDITSSLKPTGATASAILLYVAGLAALVLPLLYPLVVNSLLPVADGAVVKSLFFDTFRSAMPVLLGGGGLGVVAASALKTGGKVVAQLAPGVVTDATPNGEGITLAGAALSGNGEALQSAILGAVTSQIQTAVAPNASAPVAPLSSVVPAGVETFDVGGEAL